MRTSEPLRAIAAAFLLLLATPAVVLKSGEYAPGAVPVSLELASALREARQAKAAPAEITQRLAAPGSAALAPLLDILVEERIPRTGPLDVPQKLSLPQRALLLDALARLPRAELRAELERRLAPEPEKAGVPLRLAALRVLALVGDRADLARLPRLVPRAEDGLLAEAREAMRAAYAGILRREPALFSAGVALLRGCDEACATELLFALGELRDKRALPLLEDCMRSFPGLAQHAVALLPMIGRSGDAEFDRRLANWLADALDPERSEWTRACVRAIGVFDDGHEVEVLIGELESQHPGLRAAALDALRRVSGLKLGASVAAWREWFAQERAWQDTGAEAAELELRSGDDALVARALDAFAARRLFRDERALPVIGVLQSGSPAMRVLACRALARIGSSLALPELVERIGDDDAALSEAAWRTACELAGRTLPQERSDARRELGLD